MKRKTWTYILTVCIGMGTYYSNDLICLNADEEERQIPSRTETIGFLEKRLPLAVRVLEQVKEIEGQEKHDQVLEDLRHHLIEYRAIREADGTKAAEIYFTRIQIDLRLNLMLHQYHVIAKTKEERVELKTQIQSLLREQLEHDKRSIKLEIKLVEKELTELRTELKKLEGFGQKEIAAELKDLLKEHKDSTVEVEINK